MSSFAWMLVVVLILTLVGTATLALITVKYYWGARGRPPLTGAEKRRQQELELQMRAKQIEHARQNPIPTRKPEFWDNSKVFNDENKR